MRLALAGAWFLAVAVAQTLSPGLKAPSFTLKDLSGKPVAVESGRDRPTVVLFISTQCPISNAYNDRMIELYRSYSARARCIFVNSNDNQPQSEIDQHA